MSNFRTLRGKIEFGPLTTPSGFASRALVLDDGLINTGYVIERFEIWSADPFSFTSSTASNVIYAQLSTGVTNFGQFDAGDNRQIAWSIVDENVGVQNIIDPDHVVNRDLFIRCFNSQFVEAVNVNYIIYMRKRSLSNDEAILTIIKEDSQNIT